MSFIYSRRVRFQDTDAAGVVYFANVLAICHEAYEESLLISGINLKEFFSHPPIAFPIIHASVDFFRPMFCGDQLSINLTPRKLDVDKFEINYEISIDNFVVSKAITKHICIDPMKRNKLELPESINTWLEVTNQS